LRIFQQPGSEAFLVRRGFVAQHAGIRRTDASISAWAAISPRQHEIADRDFLDLPRGNHPLVQPLEAAAQQDCAGPETSAFTAPGQRRAARREIDQRAARTLHRIDSGSRHVGAHHHAGATAGGRIVHRAVLADAVLADVAHLQRPKILLQRLADQRHTERSGEHLGKQSEDGGGPGHSTSPCRPLPLLPARRRQDGRISRRPPVRSRA